MRKGETGKAAEDGMTPEISAAIKEWADKMVPDEAARKWMYEGGALNYTMKLAVTQVEIL